jgi:hypothetical protein
LQGNQSISCGIISLSSFFSVLLGSVHLPLHLSKFVEATVLSCMKR